MDYSGTSQVGSDDTDQDTTTGDIHPDERDFEEASGHSNGENIPLDHKSRKATREARASTSGSEYRSAEEEPTPLDATKDVGPCGPVEVILSKKRKRKGSKPLRKTKQARVWGHFKRDYVKLYNSEVKEIASKFRYLSIPTTLSVAASQIGLSEWSREEKNVFFASLESFGRDAIGAIASTIQTKSEIEVHEYILLLQDNLASHTLNAAQFQLLHRKDFPAATELSEPCCEELEMAADALAWAEFKRDREIERQKHGDYWLLDEKMAEKLGRSFYALDEDDEKVQTRSESSDSIHADSHHQIPPVQDSTNPTEGLSETHSAVPAANLLDVHNWVRLSAEIFMNSGSPQIAPHWQSVADDQEEPSIFCTALEDFHRLAVSYTKRLVSTTLLYAESRIRARDDLRSTHHYEKKVRRGDVETAALMLGLNHNSMNFWATAPRRCGLQVYRDPPRINSSKDPGEPLSYDDVERHLCYTNPSLEPTKGEEPRSFIAPPGLGQSATLENSSDETDMDEAEDSHSDIDSATELWEEFLEKNDQNVAREEEKSLWLEILDQEPPMEINLSETPLTNPGRLERKSKDDLLNWRDWIDYQPDWVTATQQDPSQFKVVTDESIRPHTRNKLSIKKHPRRPATKDSNRYEDVTSDDDEKQPKPTAKLNSFTVNTQKSRGGDEPHTKRHEKLSALPERRVLGPRQARTAATASMGQLPPIPIDDDTSADDFDPNGHESESN